MIKKINYLLVLVILLLVNSTSAQSRRQQEVEQALQQLKEAMVNADAAKLEALAAPGLTYGHSSGHVDTRQEFIGKIVSGKSDFVSIELLNQTVTMSGKTAIVRHKLNAVTNDNGKPGEVHLLVMLVWQKIGGSWKLLARQAVKAA